MRVRLLNDGGYNDGENVKFPVVVDGEEFHNNLGELCGVNILIQKLNEVGFEFSIFNDEDDETLFFSLTKGECEIVDDMTPTQTDMKRIAEVEATHDITNKCCNQFGERDEMQQIINSLQADVIARGARIAELVKQCDELYNLAIEAGVCAEYLRVNFANE